MTTESGVAPHTRLVAAFVMTVVITSLLVIASVPGILATGLYHDTSTIVATDRGSDLFTLIVVVPALAISTYLGWKGSLRAQIVWIGLLAWTAYNYAVYAYGVSFTRLFLVYVAILSLAVYTLATVVRRTDVTILSNQFGAAVPRRIAAIYMWLVAGIFSVLWLSDVIPASLSGGTPARLAQLHTTSNAVEVNDLAFIIPALVVAGIWTWQRKPIGFLLAGALLGLATVTMAALIPGGPIFAGSTPDPIYSVIALVSLIVWAVFLVKSPAIKTTESTSVIAPVERRLVT